MSYLEFRDLRKVFPDGEGPVARAADGRRRLVPPPWDGPDRPYRGDDAPVQGRT